MILPLFLLLVFTLHAEVVEKRGFVIKDEHGVFYLSPMPNVKSCCVKKLPEKIELVGDFNVSCGFSAVTLKGTYVPDSDGGKLFRDEEALGDTFPQE
ncbi:MAG: hypothetical protein KDK62_04615 [Chlamydiia bacterium]|nr:hypothetical protein [Chlamydiia bacterium]